jgi:hypothetical protein
LLYLASIHDKTGFIHRQTELKLLAKLDDGMVWHPLPRVQVLVSELGNPFSVGSLVIVETNDLQSVLSLKEATQLLVNALANVSLLHRKVREHQQEIDDWKSSLIYQTQVLSQRKLEIEKSLEEICNENIDELLRDLRQVYYQHFQVTHASKKMIVFEGELEQARNQIADTLAAAEAESSVAKRRYD